MLYQFLLLSLHYQINIHVNPRNYERKNDERPSKRNLPN